MAKQTGEQRDNKSSLVVSLPCSKFSKPLLRTQFLQDSVRPKAEVAKTTNLYNFLKVYNVRVMEMETDSQPAVLQPLVLFCGKEF